jgi:hypothetical protein
MPITNVNEFNFTTEQLDYFEKEMRKYKVPFLYKIVMGSLYKWAKYFYPIVFLVIIVLALVHNFSTVDLFPLIKGIGLVVIFGTLVPLTIAWVWNVLKTKRECKKLGLTKYQWDTLVIAFQITFI